MSLVKYYLIDIQAKSNTHGTVISDKTTVCGCVDMLQIDLKFSFLSDFLCHNMILEKLCFDGNVDVFGLDGKGSITFNFEDIGVPIDIDFLCDIGHVHFDMDKIERIIVGDIGCFETID